MYFGWLWLLEFYLEHRHTPKMEHFAKMGRSEKPLTIFARRSILDVWLVSEYILWLLINNHCVRLVLKNKNIHSQKSILAMNIL